MWVCIYTLALCVVDYNRGTFSLFLPLSPIKEPGALQCQPHMAQLTPNKLCSLPEDVAAATLSALKDVIWLVTWTLIEGPVNRVTNCLDLPRTVPVFNEKFPSPTPLVLGFIAFQFFVLTQENSTTWDGCSQLALLPVALTICFDISYLFNSVGMQLVLTFVLCSNPRVFKLYLTELHR